MQFSLKLNGNCKIKSILKDLNASNKINLNWFNKNNIGMVDDTVEEHINDLLDIKDYVELNRKFNQLTLELTSYQNSLAYYIALTKK